MLIQKRQIRRMGWLTGSGLPAAESLLLSWLSAERVVPCIRLRVPAFLPRRSRMPAEIFFELMWLSPHRLSPLHYPPY
jgi:hypothetical protein